MSRLCWLACAVTLSLAPAAQTLYEPGTTDELVGTVGAIATGFGNLAVGDDGSIYVTAGTSSDVYRRVPGGSFAPFAAVPAGWPAAVTVDGIELFAATRMGDIYVFDLAGTPPTPFRLASLPGGTFVSDMELSPDGRKLAISTTAGLYEVDRSTAAVTPLDLGTPYSSLARSADGASILLVNRATAELLTIKPPASPVFVTSTDPAPDGIAVNHLTADTYIACSGGANTLVRVNAGGTTKTVLGSDMGFDPDALPTALEFSADGRTLYYTTARSGQLVVRSISGFATAGGGLLEPPAGATVAGDVTIEVEATSAGAPVSLTFEFSRDAGATFLPCAPTACSPLATNPTAPLPTPVLAATFIWDSFNDGLGFSAAEPVELRLSIDDGLTVDTVQISATVDNTTSAHLLYPSCDSSVLGLVQVGFEARDAEGDPLVATFEYSTDGGSSWSACTPAVQSPLANPTPPLPTPVLASAFIWDSFNDGLGLIAVQPADIRVTVSDIVGDGWDDVEILIDNLGCSNASVVVPGFPLRLLGEISIGSRHAFGGIAEDGDGNLFVSSGALSSPAIYRQTPGGPFLPYFSLPGAGELYGLAVRGRTLYVAAANRSIHSFDLVKPLVPPLVVTTIPDLPGALHVSRTAPTLLAGSDGGVHAIDLTLRTATPLFGVGSNLPGVCYSPDETAVLATAYDLGEVVSHTGVGGGTTTLASVGNWADSLVVQPRTGDVFVALGGQGCGSDRIVRLDPTGVFQEDFVVGADFGLGASPTPLAFSPTGATLYFAAANQGADTASVFAINGFPSVFDEAITEPTRDAVVGGDITVTFATDHAHGTPLVATLAFSVNGGATFENCTPAACSPLQNPTPPLPSPSFAIGFGWNSIDDEIGMLAPRPVLLQLTVSDGYAAESASVPLVIDNATRAAIQSPACGATVSDQVTLLFDADDAEGDPVTVVCEFSLDGGVTYTPCSPRSGSPLGNPALLAQTPALAQTFEWDTRLDGLPPSAAVPTLVRVVVDDGVGRAGSDVVELTINTAAGCAWQCGDCDASGSVSIVDSLIAAQHAVGRTEILPGPRLGCDVANPAGGEVTILDALLIARYVVGRVATLSCCQ